jgi:hypothetical protein
MSSVKFSCTVTSSDPTAELGLEVWLDGTILFNCDHVIEPQKISVLIPDQNEAEHVLKLVMKNKKLEHTQLDNQGNILQDCILIVSDLAFDKVIASHAFYSLAKYDHDFNGSGPATQQKFFGELGCNGTVKLEFSTPMYEWLLDYL